MVIKWRMVMVVWWYGTLIIRITRSPPCLKGRLAVARGRGSAFVVDQRIEVLLERFEIFRVAKRRKRGEARKR